MQECETVRPAREGMILSRIGKAPEKWVFCIEGTVHSSGERLKRLKLNWRIHGGNEMNGSFHTASHLPHNLLK